MKTMTRYAIVGLGSRSSMYSHAILHDFPQVATLAAFCDSNQTRMDTWNRRYAGVLQGQNIPTFKPAHFEAMIQECDVDTVIVTTADSAHHEYIVRAMEAGCDVICEKPMTIDLERAQSVLDVIERTGKKLTVTFNYRYAPRATKVRELLRDGVIGDVLSVHFEWLLDTLHGAEYFRRWHRDKANSGGLMVHKATHHFDLVNWWLQSTPQTVFAFGKLGFYGRENAEARGENRTYDRYKGHEQARRDPFFVDFEADENIRELYLDAEHEDGYIRDRSVFADGINIEDDMAVLVRYENGADMTYHLTAYSPWEGYRIAFNGTKGRLEYEVHENSFISGADNDGNRAELRDTVETEIVEPATLCVRPLWGKPYHVEMPEISGGHGGGDERLLSDLFLGVQDDSLGHSADELDGALSILTGIAANLSMQSGQAVEIEGLLRVPQKELLAEKLLAEELLAV